MDTKFTSKYIKCLHLKSSTKSSEAAKEDTAREIWRIKIAELDISVFATSYFNKDKGFFFNKNLFSEKG